MKETLGQIAESMGGALVKGQPNPYPSGVTYDSRKVKEGFIFVAVKGFSLDGHEFIPQAIRNGAVCVVSESDPPTDFPVAWIKVADVRSAMATAADIVYGYPSNSLDLIGITGTNGKTTTAFLVNGLLEAVGMKSAILSTVEYRIAGTSQEAARTTPESSDTNEFLRRAVDGGCTVAVMEASSQALDLRRCDHLSFKTAVFTNLTRDHLDYHGTMESYFDSKARLFDGRLGTNPETAIINIDDEWGRRLADIIDPSKTRVITFGIDSPTADIIGKDVSVSMLGGTSFNLDHGSARFRVSSELIGIPHTYNILAAYAVGSALGLDSEELVKAIKGCKGAPGRFERVPGETNFAVFVDYAHTDDALENTLKTARRICDGRVITVFGCGGDRDRTKRAPMGKIAGELSDYVVVTSDNPRSEDPMSIISEIASGLATTSTEHALIIDRREAISIALELAQDGDIVLICGKGHEPYQIIGDQTLHFDDREVAAEIIASL
jgi:UDP-N-acetylmuramoyl-L-alanyl-D-glutamate--2,6-diaminopimelate ligase